MGERTRHHWEIAARGGHPMSRCGLGRLDCCYGKKGRALKHFMISANMGFEESLHEIKEMVINGEATREEYAKALVGFQDFREQAKSPLRDEYAKAFKSVYEQGKFRLKK